MDALQLPFLITNYKMLADAFEAKEGQALLDGLDSIGLKGLGLLRRRPASLPVEREDHRKARRLQRPEDARGAGQAASRYLESHWRKPDTRRLWRNLYLAANRCARCDRDQRDVDRGRKLDEVAKNLTLTSQYFFGCARDQPEETRHAQRQGSGRADQGGTRHDAQAGRAAAEQDAKALEEIKGKGVKVAEFKDFKAMRTALVLIDHL